MGILKKKKDKKKEGVKVEKAETKSKSKAAKKVSTPKKQESSVRFSAKGAEAILRPLVTEKTATLAADGQYVFVVKKDANRVEIKTAIRSMYGVLPASVNIQNVKGKKVRFGRTRGKRKDWKKAIVTLPKGKTINVYEGV